MSFDIKPATRTGVKPLVGMYGKSSSGKTMSALLLARGIVGPAGRVTLIDTESGRGSLFADLIPGGYNVIDIEPPFSPERYEEAIITAEARSDCVIVDSLSHEHGGEGGVLDMQEAELSRMAGDNWTKREQCKMASWIKPKFAHKKFIGRLLRLKCALICCLRGEEKTHMVKGDDGKNKVVTDQFSSPLFDPRFIFELLLNFELISIDGKGGFVIPRKITHPTILPLLPKDNEQIGVKHGELIAQWCLAPGKPTPAAAAKPKPASDTKPLRDKLWATLEPIRGFDPNWKKATQWLLDECGMDPDKRVSTLTAQELERFIRMAEEKLGQGVTP